MISMRCCRSELKKPRRLHKRPITQVLTGSSYISTTTFTTHESFEGGTIMRTNLKSTLRKTDGKCLATNPIDRCWRCDPNWAKNQ
ncbi:hypothetical protein Patl1_17847 [Pistacia atlantica]|uniref:Uncharacterized protein n=1 Tax=Pistacia atlantica TaxID=434234 RepID=A0ACC1BZB7_9ROSI|nr:hypothetical protein Patl1_17847 [Pistacia atlantica]